MIEQLKGLLTSSYALKLPNPNKMFYVTISYSSLGYGACLM